MENATRIFGISVLVALFGPGTVLAQQPASAPLPLIEIFGCKFKANKDMDDLNAVASRYNAWADRNNIRNYTAMTLTPVFHSADMTYDVLWLGAWPNGAAMGADMALWVSQGKDIAAEFNAVVECDAVINLAAFNIRPPAAGGPRPGGLVSFSDCTLREGRVVAEAIQAYQTWSNFQAENGVATPSWLLFPVAGKSSDETWNFKTVNGYDSPQAYGKAVDMVTSGGIQRANEIFERVVQCNSQRVYASNPVRVAAEQ